MYMYFAASVILPQPTLGRRQAESDEVMFEETSSSRLEKRVIIGMDFRDQSNPKYRIQGIDNHTNQNASLPSVYASISK